MERSTTIGLFLLPVVIATLAAILSRVASGTGQKRGVVIMLAVASVLFCLGLFFVVIDGDKSQTTAHAQTQQSNRGPCPSLTVGKSSDLIGVIRQQQQACVGDSIGVWAHQAFTTENLKGFLAEKKVEKIVASLKTNQEFLQLVEVIRSMPAARREELLAQGASAYRPTWTEIGTDPETASIEALRRGQTDAGNTAERLIAEGITDLLKSLLPA